MPIRGDLQDQSLETRAVVSADGAFVLLTQDVFQTAANPEHKSRSVLRGRLGKLGIEGGEINVLQVAISRRHAGDTGQRQLLGQTALVGAIDDLPQPCNDLARHALLSPTTTIRCYRTCDVWKCGEKIAHIGENQHTLLY